MPSSIEERSERIGRLTRPATSRVSKLKNKLEFALKKFVQ
jgi:hypothetical protein